MLRDGMTIRHFIDDMTLNDLEILKNIDSDPGGYHSLPVASNPQLPRICQKRPALSVFLKSHNQLGKVLVCGEIETFPQSVPSLFYTADGDV